MSAKDPRSSSSQPVGASKPTEGVEPRTLDLLIPPHPTATAGTILWRSSGDPVWSDGCAQQLVAGGPAGLADLLAADARSLGRGRGSVLVERVVPARGGAWVRSRTSACAGVAGVDAVTTLELVRAVVLTATDLSTRYQLTEKELHIATLVSEGLGNRAISYRVDLAVPTVGMYLTRIFKKTGTLDRQDLTRLMLTGLPDSTPAGSSVAPSPRAMPPQGSATCAPAKGDIIAAGATPHGAWRTPAARRGRSGPRRWRGP